MDAEEKLTALKKAFADIILGISKEAAARVMASERKSVRYQHELKVAKEEGVRMLLRLKQMTDSQISEVEATSLSQQMKIEELEAQLQEAEDIVSDLREELGEAQAELEWVKNENLLHGNGPENNHSRETHEGNEIYSYQLSKYLVPPNEPSVASDVRVPYVIHRNECRKCDNKIDCTCGDYTRNQDLPSIILRGKELGLYRNGCTQRIRACERNILDRDLCLSEEIDEVKNGNEGDEGKDISEAPAGAKTLSELENKLFADTKVGSFQSFLRKRKRGIRRRKPVIPLGQKQSSLFLKRDQLPERRLISGPISDKDSAHSDESTSRIDPRLSEGKAKPQTQLGRAEDFEKERHVQVCGTKKTMHKDDGGNIKLDVEKVGDGLESNLSNATKELPSQTVKGRVIKYTFQRKRKRQTESNGCLEMEKQTGDSQNGNPRLKQSKSSLLMESSRDSRRLAQVARQLISLSEKKWWN